MESRLEGFKRTFLNIVGDQRPHHSVAKQGHFAGQVSRNAPAVVVIRPTECAKIKQQSLEKTKLVAQPVQPVAHTRPVTCCQTEFNYGGNP